VRFLVRFAGKMHNSPDFAKQVLRTIPGMVSLIMLLPREP